MNAPAITISETTGERHALRSFLGGIVDYAGLFPPAQLDLDTAIRNFARYQASDDAWMLNRFVIPAKRLDELDAYGELFSDASPLRCSVLGAGAGDSASFLEALENDLATITEFHSRHKERMRAEAMEVRWPEGLLDSRAEALASFLDEVAGRFEKAGLNASNRQPFDLYLELPLDDRTSERLEPVLEALQQHSRLMIAHKFRCGGARPEDHPDPQVIAPIVTALRDAGVPFKATAGLHHPTRHYNDDAGAHMLGFLNVFGGAILAAARGLDEETILRILEDEEAGHFLFDDDSFAWQEYSVTTAEISNLRRFATTFGSCSFDEPREDLRRLGLLANASF